MAMCLCASQSAGRQTEHWTNTLFSFHFSLCPFKLMCVGEFWSELVYIMPTMDCEYCNTSAAFIPKYFIENIHMLCVLFKVFTCFVTFDGFRPKKREVIQRVRGRNAHLNIS